MRTRTRILRLGAAATALTLLLSAEEPAAETPLPDDPVALQQELQSVLRTLRQVRERHYARKQELDDRARQLAEQVRQAEQEAARLSEEQDTARQRIQTLEEEVAARQDESQTGQALGAAVREQIGRFLRAAQQAAADGLPEMESKQEGLPRLAQRLEAESSGPGGFADLLDLAWRWSEGRLRGATEGISFTAEAALSGERRKPARFCRLGNVLAVFVTEDGTECGYRSHSRAPEQEWRWVLDPDLSEEVRAEIREAVRILDRRDPPRLQLLPVYLQFPEIRDAAR